MVVGEIQGCVCLHLTSRKGEKDEKNIMRIDSLCNSIGWDYNSKE